MILACNSIKSNAQQQKENNYNRAKEQAHEKKNGKPNVKK